jgi:hypothetical protein
VPSALARNAGLLFDKAIPRYIRDTQSCPAEVVAQKIKSLLYLADEYLIGMLFQFQPMQTLG